MPRDQVAANQRDRVVDAFVQLVSEQGYAPSGVAATCKRAGISNTTFYSLVKSKDHLAVEALVAGEKVLFECAANAVNASRSADIVDQEGVALKAVLNVLAMNPTFARYWATIAPIAEGPIRERLDRTFQWLCELRAQSQARANCCHTNDIDALIIGGIYARIYVSVRAGRIADLPGLAPALLRFYRI